MKQGDLKIIFSQAGYPRLHQCTGEKLSTFEIECNEKNLARIQKVISLTDAGFQDYLAKGNEVTWNVKVTEDQASTKRFKKFLPLLVRQKASDRLLYDYQNEGVNWLRANKNCILADDMGLGKTLQVIKACELELYQKKIVTIFIFCPNSLVENWKHEIKKWLPTANFSQFQKLELNRQVSNFTFLITPYSQVENFIDELNPLVLKNTISVFDEAHKLRNEGAKVSSFSRKFKAPSKWLLTGTPLERDTKDIETILKILTPGLSVGTLMKDQFLLKSRFANITLRRTKTDVLKDLPKVTKHIHYLELSQEQKLSYDILLKKYRRTTRPEKIGLLTNLLITATFSETGESNKIQAATNICEIEALKNHKTIIFSKFNKALELTSTNLLQRGIQNELVYGLLDKTERNLRLTRFRLDDQCKVLVINLSIGSEGLTLTEANNVIFLNEAWNPSMNRQAEDRVNRIGQHKPVNIHILRSKETIDISLEKILETKNKLEREYVDDLIGEIFHVDTALYSSKGRL